MREIDVASVGRELIAVWGRERLTRLHERAVHDVAIPAASKWLLSEIGLPAFWGVHYLTDLADGGEELPRHSCHSAASPHYGNYGDYRVLSTTRLSWPPSVYHICLDERHEGAIVQLHRRLQTSPEPSEERINTSVGRFATYLLLHRRLLSQAASLSIAMFSSYCSESAPKPVLEAYYAAVNRILDTTEQSMRHLDPEIWEGITEPRRDFYGDEGVDRYWPGLLADYGEYSMWSAEEVLQRWSGELFSSSG